VTLIRQNNKNELQIPAKGLIHHTGVRRMRVVESTRNEITYATKIGKKIHYYSQEVQ
jgi:hypothetical protein